MSSAGFGISVSDALLSRQQQQQQHCRRHRHHHEEQQGKQRQQYWNADSAVDDISLCGGLLGGGAPERSRSKSVTFDATGVIIIGRSYRCDGDHY